MRIEHPFHSERDSSALSNLMVQLEVRLELDHFIRRRPGLCWPSRDQGVEVPEHRVLGREVTLSGYCSQLYHLRIIPCPRDRMSGGEAMIWTVLLGKPHIVESRAKEFPSNGNMDREFPQVQE